LAIRQGQFILGSGTRNIAAGEKRVGMERLGGGYPQPPLGVMWPPKGRKAESSSGHAQLNMKKGANVSPIGQLRGEDLEAGKDGLTSARGEKKG